jgi:hypothetical protein
VVHVGHVIWPVTDAPIVLVLQQHKNLGIKEQ